MWEYGEAVGDEQGKLRWVDTTNGHGQWRRCRVSYVVICFRFYFQFLNPFFFDQTLEVISVEGKSMGVSAISGDDQGKQERVDTTR